MFSSCEIFEILSKKIDVIGLAISEKNNSDCFVVDGSQSAASFFSVCSRFALVDIQEGVVLAALLNRLSVYHHH